MATIELVYILFLTVPTLASLSFTYSLASQLAPNSDQAVISSAYPLNDTVGVRVPLGWSFSIGLRPDTCSGEGPIRYSAPDLPSWIIFKSTELTFTGTGPFYFSDTQISLVCSAGTEKLSESFAVRVQGQLGFNFTLPPLIAASRNSIAYDMQHAIKHLRLDGSHLDETQMHDLSVDPGQSYGWLQWNGTSFQLQGVPPDSYIGVTGPQTLDVPLTFELPDALDTLTLLNTTIEPYLLAAATYPSLYIYRELNLSLTSLLTNKSVSITLTYDPPDASQWIRYNQSTTTLLGDVPRRLEYSRLSIMVVASQPDTGFTATATIPVFITAHGLLLVRDTVALVALLSIFGAMLLLCIGYLVSVRCFSAGTEERNRPITNEVDTATSEKTPTTRMRVTVTGDTLVGSPDPVSAAAGMRRLWIKATSRVSLAPSSATASRATSNEPSESGARPSHAAPSTPKICGQGAPSRLRTRSSPEIPLRNLRPPGNELIVSGSLSPLTSDGELWGPPLPQPPRGLTPEQLAAWMTNFASEWALAYGSGSKKDTRRKRRSAGGRIPSQVFPDHEWSLMGTVDGSAASQELMPNTLEPSSSRATSLTHSMAIISPELMDASGRPSIRRSASYPNTINTHTTAASSLGPSDNSSVASWDSLDSWEMERRANYEEPQRRKDFMPSPGVRLVGPSKARRYRDKNRSRSRSRDDRHRESGHGLRKRSPAVRQNSLEYSASIQGDRTTGSDEVPSIVVTAFGDSASGSQFSAAMFQAIDHATASYKRPVSASDDAWPPNSSKLAGPRLSSLFLTSPDHDEAPCKDGTEKKNVEPDYSRGRAQSTADEEEENIFFPRPLGAETPGTGLARSPLLDGLSKFTGSSAKL